MPIYTFEGPDGQRFSQRLSMTNFRAILEGEKALLDEDDNELKPVFDPGRVGFVLKDGVSGGWPSKVDSERKYRRRRYREMGRRQREHAPKTKLVPNYGGQLADRWSDIQDHVRTTKGEVPAMTYDHLVAKEKQGGSS